ncbi:hypothetical protein HYC85_029536 [Camellia sinensis]|uniref:Uncharacterized protein n=1 Tax=Camellia sinensis TaxID=4442 RepID=A0A7J7FYV5_CAMSI|nr:hypothetical protein HYC85_029536 [Camellia sinensis]
MVLSKPVSLLRLAVQLLLDFEGLHRDEVGVLDSLEEVDRTKCCNYRAKFSYSLTSALRSRSFGKSKVVDRATPTSMSVALSPTLTGFSSMVKVIIWKELPVARDDEIIVPSALVGIKEIGDEFVFRRPQLKDFSEENIEREPKSTLYEGYNWERHRVVLGHDGVLLPGQPKSLTISYNDSYFFSVILHWIWMTQAIDLWISKDDALTRPNFWTKAPYSCSSTSQFQLKIGVVVGIVESSQTVTVKEFEPEALVESGVAHQKDNSARKSMCKIKQVLTERDIEEPDSSRNTQTSNIILSREPLSANLFTQC